MTRQSNYKESDEIQEEVVKTGVDSNMRMSMDSFVVFNSGHKTIANQSTIDYNKDLMSENLLS